MAATRTRAISRRRYFARPRHHWRAKPTIPLAVVAGFAPLAVSTVYGYKIAGTHGAAENLIRGLSGYNITTHQFEMAGLMDGALPIVFGVFAHKLANRLGVNRALAKTGIPYIRI